LIIITILSPTGPYMHVLLLVGAESPALANENDITLGTLYTSICVRGEFNCGGSIISVILSLKLSHGRVSQLSHSL
jgi:hypothetical protein